VSRDKTIQLHALETLINWLLRQQQMEAENSSQYSSSSIYSIISLENLIGAFPDLIVLKLCILCQCFYVYFSITTEETAPQSFLALHANSTGIKRSPNLNRHSCHSKNNLQRIFAFLRGV
jgi:hypothetical protein